MKLEKWQELAALTDEASANNDIDSLIKIYKILQSELAKEKTAFGSMGIEWFQSSLTPDQWDSILISIKS